MKKKRNVPERKITWRNYPVTRRGRQGRENVMLTPGGVMSAPAKAADTPAKCFDIFFTAEMMTTCVDMTNLHIQTRINSLPVDQQNRKNDSSKYPFMNGVDTMEMRAYLGLVLLRGCTNRTTGQWQGSGKRRLDTLCSGPPCPIKCSCSYQETSAWLMLLPEKTGGPMTDISGKWSMMVSVRL